SKLVVDDDGARRAVSRRPGHRMARAEGSGDAAGDEPEQQFLLPADSCARRAPCRRNFCSVLCEFALVGALSNYASDCCGTDGDLLAFYGRALGFSALTPDSGTVNRA